MAESKKKPTKKIIDVAQPGKTPPPVNSKAVIVTNRPIMKDPMVVDEAASPADLPTESAKPKTEAVIMPLAKTSEKTEKTKTKTTKSKKSESSEPEPVEIDNDKTIAVLAEEAAVKEEESIAEGKSQPATETETAPPVETPLEEPPAAPVDQPDIEPVVPEPETNTESTAGETEDGDTTDTAADKPEAAADQTPAEDEAASTKTDQSVAEAEAAEAAEQDKHDAAIQKMVDNKQYFLPINSVEKRRSKRVFVLGAIVSVLLILLWVDIALDASLIEIQGIKPVTHFFSN